MLGRMLFQKKILQLFPIFMLVFLWAGCSERTEQATPQLMDQLESDWHSSGIHNYRIVVDVERPEELRRNDITVSHDQIAKGFVLYWQSKEKRWDNMITLNESQSIAFSVPGLLETLRSEINNTNRPVVRVATSKTPPYIKKILLGQIRQNNQPVPGSQATIIVQTFEQKPK
jgi:hypothetical protein